MERFNFQVIEKKWKDKILSSKLYRKSEKILLSRNVSVSIRKNSYGTCKKLYYR